MRISVIIPAAGSGRRLGKEKNKILLELGSKPVLSYSLEFFDTISQVAEIIIVAAGGEEEECRSIAKDSCRRKEWQVVTGGEERRDSVYRGLKAASPDCDYILIHDGARPFITHKLMDNLLTADFQDGAILALPLKDTVKRVEAGCIKKTIARAGLYGAQTPQIFHRDILLKAYEYALDAGFEATDDASMVELYGGEVIIVPGSEDNFKITTPYDWQKAREKVMTMGLRIGSGFDVHGFIAGRPLILGGEEIRHDFGLEGHSDADVVTHALMDAVLGALCAGDIGGHFPPGDPVYKGADSIVLLKRVAAIMGEKNYELINGDITVIAQKPKLAPYIEKIRSNLAEALETLPENISVKATTTEKLGFVGREEGIAAQATVLLRHK